MEETMFAKLSDDVVLNIFAKLEDDPRNWARLACVCAKFSSLVRNVCWKNKCLAAIPAVASDLLVSASAEPPGGWAALHKIAVCCPGLVHSGVLLEHSDFGLERDLGPDEHYGRLVSSLTLKDPNSAQSGQKSDPSEQNSGCAWSLYDDLYYDTVYQASEAPDASSQGGGEEEVIEKGVFRECGKRRKVCRQMRAHLAAGVWKLSREQGSKLLHSRFRGDCLYICDWPGCVHIEEKRSYMLFRGVFRDFKATQVWRTIKDGNRSKIDLNCAFCGCGDTWDLHSAFCLRRVFGFHDDGEPVVRAYVCDNGHVSGAWTDLPLYA